MQENSKYCEVIVFGEEEQFYVRDGLLEVSHFQAINQ